MDNYKSTYTVDITSPAVFSFNITKDCKQYTFGLSQYNSSDYIEQNLFVLKNIPYWKSFLKYETSCYKSNDTYIISNFGNTFLGKSIIIFQKDYQSNQYTFTDQIDKRTGIYNTHLYKNDENKKLTEIDITNVSIDYSSYIETFDDSNEEIIIYSNDKKFIEQDLNIIPSILKNKIHTSSLSHSNEEVYLIIDNDGNDISFLCTDYECNLHENDVTTTTLFTMVDDVIETTHYINDLNYDKVRFVISDNGRYISHSTSLNGGEYKNNKGFLLSVEPKNQSNKNVSVRFSIGNKIHCSNLTSNFPNTPS